MFERYAELGSLPKLQQELRQRGIVTRRRKLSSGVTVGGVHLTNGPLAYLLRNRVYLGEINHREKSYPGQHPSRKQDDAELCNQEGRPVSLLCV
jgi:site-specific DNA recombinase